VAAEPNNLGECCQQTTLDPRQLRAFLSIVRSGSLGLAAESLHVTQPALSRIVRRLESQLGVQLFERRTTGMELTTFGHALLPHATVLSEEAALAIEQINSLRYMTQIGKRVAEMQMALASRPDIARRKAPTRRRRPERADGQTLTGW